MSQPITGIILTLPLANTKYNLLALIISAQTTLGTPVADGNCSELNIYNNNAFGGAVVYVGGADLNAATNNGFPLSPTLAAGGQGASYRFGPYEDNTFPLANVWLQASANAATVQVLLCVN